MSKGEHIQKKSGRLQVGYQMPRPMRTPRTPLRFKGSFDEFVPSLTVLRRINARFGSEEQPVLKVPKPLILKEAIEPSSVHVRPNHRHHIAPVIAVER